MENKRSKPLPAGYICKACGGSDHSIHDCPNKVAKKQKNQSNSELLSNNQNTEHKKESIQISKPSLVEEVESSSHHEKDNSRKAYISGLPFHITKVKLKEILEKVSCDIAFITLVCFPDNPSKCKGVAFVTFKDELSVQKAMELNGTEMEGKVLKVEAYRSESTSMTKSSASLEPPTLRADNKRCYRCGGKHDAKACTNSRICYRCKSADHLSFDCPQKKPPVNPRKTVFNVSENDS